MAAAFENRRGASWMNFALSFLLGVVLFTGYAAFSGQDANWDLQNYHDYAAFALLHWRYPLDVAPGGPQTYLNPLPYVLPYLLRHHLPPVVAAAALAAVQALVVPLAWALSGLVVAGRDRQALAVRVLATFTAVTGAITLSEVGTSFADLLLAVFGLAALLAMLRAGAEEGGRADRLHLLAGILSGAAAGLKLTNAVVVAGLLGATILPWKSLAQSSKASGLVVLGAALGAGLTGGWWALYLWRSLGSPTFPFLNTVFRSHSAVLLDFSDPRHLPHGVVDALAYPFKIAAGLHPTSESAFQDWRFALALPLIAAFALSKLPSLARCQPVPPVQLAILRASAFLLVGFGAWLFSFAIQRYAIVFEAAAGLLAVAIIAAVLPRRISLLACLLAATGILALTRPADWWRRPWSDTYVPHPPAEVVGTPAAYLFITLPLGYWVSSLPRQSRSYLLYPFLLEGGGQLNERFTAGLDHPPGGTIWGVGFDSPIEPRVRANMAGHGFVLAPPCFRARSLWWVDTVFCRAEHVGRRPFAASDLRIGGSVSFSNNGSGLIYEASGWQPPDAAGTWAEGPASTLVLKPEASSQLLAVDFQVAGLVGPAWPESEINMLIPGAPASSWTLRQGESGVVHTACVPAALKLQDGVLQITFQNPKPHTPQDVGLGPDPRPLSFSLRRMELRYARPGECDG